MSHTVVIRPAHATDAPALARLAALDSRPRLSGAVLLAERDGELVAALAVDSRCSVADPFRPSDDLVALLELHAARSRPARSTRRARRPGWHPAPRPRAA